MWKATIFLKFLALSAVVLLNDNNGIEAAYAHGYLNNAVAGGANVGGGIRGGGDCGNGGNGGFNNGNGGFANGKSGFPHGNGGSTGGSQGARIGRPGGTYSTGFDYIGSTELSPVRSGLVTVEGSGTNSKMAINRPKINYGNFEYKPTRQGYVFSYELVDGTRRIEVGIIPGAENVPIYQTDERTKTERQKAKGKNRKLSPKSLESLAG